jgi:rhodanese-related sulfurtransferase
LRLGVFAVKRDSPNDTLFTVSFHFFRFDGMKKNHYAMLVLLVMVTGVGVGAQRASEKKYVCLPCGRDCDSKLHDQPGICEMCKMNLVDAQSIRFKNISFRQLCARIKANKDVVLLDCRSKEEFDNTITSGEAFGKFKNAININVYELQDRVTELSKFKDREVIVYCSHSHRSPQASYLLTTQGFSNVSNVSGGVSTLQTDPARDCLKDQFLPFQAK